METIQFAGDDPPLYINMEDLPVGCYKVDSSSGREIIVSCNQYFAQLFDFSSPGEVVGMDIKDLHGSIAQYDKFLKMLRLEHARGSFLQMFQQRVKTKTGRILLVEIHCRLVLDKDGKEVGRVGMIRDLTPEMQVALRSHELTKDFGPVLHSFSQFLLMLSFASQPALSALSRGIRDKSPEQIDVTVLSELALELSRQIRYVVKQSISARVDPEEIKVLRKHRQDLAEHRDVIPLQEQYAPALRELAVRTYAILDKWRDVLTRDSYVSIRTVAWRLERACCVVSLRHAREAAIGIEHEVRSVREYVTPAASTESTVTVCLVEELIREGIRDLAGFAHNRGVKIHRDRDFSLKVEVIKRDVVRAISNIVHNAIKYSYSPRNTRGASISLSCRSSDSDARIEVCNWGVGIESDEIDSGLIYNLGYRGRLAQQGFPGTGVGLTDAKRVIEASGGRLEVYSERTGGSEDISRSDLFLTKVVILLPGTDKELPSTD